MFVSYVRKNQRRLTKYSTRPQAGLTTDVRLLKSVSIILLLLSLMWMPQMIAMALEYSGTPVDWPQRSYLLLTGLLFSNSSVNSIVYAATHPNFREGYLIFIKKVCCLCQTANNELSIIST